MSATGDTWTFGDTIKLNELGWTLFGSEHQAPADHRPETEAWVTKHGEMVVGEPGDGRAWISSDTVREVVR